MKKIFKQSGIYALAALLVSCVLGCRTLPMAEPENFGLPLLELTVASEDEAVLNSTIWEKTPVPADLTMDGKKRRVDLKYAGKSSLDDFKKNYEIKFRDRDLYQGRGEIKLSAQAIDPSALRSTLGFWAYKQGGLIASDIEPVTLYLNNKFKGLYFKIESVDEEFFSAHRIDRGIVYKAIFGNADFGTKTLQDPGSAFAVPLDSKDFTVIKRLSELVLSEAPVSVRIAEIESILDVKSVLDYVAVSVAINHFDGFANNYYFYLDRLVGKFRVLPWDLDRIFENDTVEFSPGVSIWGGNRLSLLLLTIPEYKKYYLNKLQSLLNGPLSVAGCLAQLEVQKKTIGAAWPNDRVLSAKDRSLESEAGQLLVNIEVWHRKISDDLVLELQKAEQ